MHYSIIINPVAGGHRGASVWPALKEQLVAAKVSFTARQTKEKDGAFDLAQRLVKAQQESPAALIIVGGDGTVREAISGMLSAGQTLPVGIVPVGYQNHFAKEHQLTGEPTSVLTRILATREATSLPISYFHEAIKQEQGCFLTSLEIGLGAASQRSLPKGFIGRLLALFASLYNQAPFTLMIQTGRKRELLPNALIVLARTRPREANPDLLVVEHHNWLIAFWTGWLLLRGRIETSRWVRHFQGPSIHFTTTSLEFTTADHEPIGNRFIDLTITRKDYPFLVGPTPTAEDKESLKSAPERP